MQTGHTTLSSTPDQQLENHSTKYHMQQPLYISKEDVPTWCKQFYYDFFS